MDQSSRPRRECTAGGTRCRKPPGAPSRCVGLDPGRVSLHQCRHPLIAWLPVTAHFHKYAAGCTQVKASLLLPTSVAPQQVRAGCSFDVQVHASSTTTAEDAIPSDGLQICLLLPGVQDAERALVDCPHKVLRVQDGVQGLHLQEVLSGDILHSASHPSDNTDELLRKECKPCTTCLCSLLRVQWCSDLQEHMGHELLLPNSFSILGSLVPTHAPCHLDDIQA